MAFIAGGFTATVGGDDIGVVREGFTIEYFRDKELIVGDNMGTTPQDAVNAGLEMFIEFELDEWDQTGIIKTLWPWSSTFGDAGTYGVLDSALNVATVLTAIAGTSAAAAMSNWTQTAQDTWTFANTQLAENFPVRILMSSSRLRRVPIRMRVYPNASDVFFTLS